MEQQFTNKKTYLETNIYLTNYQLGVFTVEMLFSNIKIIKKSSNQKATIVKTGVVVSLAAYWSVILVGTFITFN